MALIDYRADAMRLHPLELLHRWIPFDLVKSHRFAERVVPRRGGKFTRIRRRQLLPRSACEYGEVRSPTRSV